MKIRNVRSEDYDEVLKLQLELEDVECTFDMNLIKRCYDTNNGKIKLQNRINNEDNIFLVAECEGIIVGFVDGYIASDEWWYESSMAYLSHIIVSKEYRNQGIGTALIKKFENEVKTRNVDYIKLLVFTNNEKAINFYKSNDYTNYSIYLRKRI